MMNFMLKPYCRLLTEENKHEGTRSATALTYLRVSGLNWEIQDKKNKNNKHLNPLSAFNKKLLTFTFFSQVQLFKIYLIVFLTYLLQ